MSKQPNLLDVPENPSPRLRRIAELSGTLEVAKKVHGILTHWADIGELPWLAVLTEPGETRDIGQLVSEECWTLEVRCGRTDYGDTEIQAVVNLMQRRCQEAPELKLLVELIELEGLR